MPTIQSLEMILTVPNVKDTLDWYERVLGWKGTPDVFDADGQINFGGVCANQDPPLFIDFTRYHGEDSPYCNNPCQLTILVYVDEVDALYRRVVASGARPDSAPQNQFWGSRTFGLRDLNGFYINFAQKVEQFQGDELQKRYEQDK